VVRPWTPEEQDAICKRLPTPAAEKLRKSFAVRISVGVGNLGSDQDTDEEEVEVEEEEEEEGEEEFAMLPPTLEASMDELGTCMGWGDEAWMNGSGGGFEPMALEPMYAAGPSHGDHGGAGTAC